MNDRFDVLERYARLFEAPEPSFEGFLRRRDRRRRNQRIAAGVVGIAVFLAAIAVITTSPADRSVTPGGGGEPQPTIAPEAASIVGLPNPGAEPSTPKHGRLVLYLEGNSSAAAAVVWVYADGRIIAGDVPGGTFPADAPTDGATGFVEQHLTPAGVEFLQDQALSTGLFEHSLELNRDTSGFLLIQVRRGERLVQLTWGAFAPEDTPAATPEQATALDGLLGLVADPTSWPAYAWEDRDPETFVPSKYQVWLRVLPDGDGPGQPVGPRDVALLPVPAPDLLRQGTYVRDATYELTTDDTRALAAALIDAGLEPLTMPMGEAVTRFGLDDPYEPGSSLYVFFGPVLPHGEAVFLGPG